MCSTVALVRARFYLHLVYAHRETKIIHFMKLILSENPQHKFNSELSVSLTSKQLIRDNGGHWWQVTKALNRMKTQAKYFMLRVLRKIRVTLI